MPPHEPSRRTRLRVYWPTHPRKGSAPHHLNPQVALLDINGFPCRLTHWTPREWASIPPRLRPQHAFAGDRGDHYTLDIDG